MITLEVVLKFIRGLFFPKNPYHMTEGREKRKRDPDVNFGEENQGACKEGVYPFLSRSTGKEEVSTTC